MALSVLLAKRQDSYGYQGAYSESDARTRWNRFALRGNYDSRLGRWQLGDPYAQFASPYVGMGNSAINGADADGGLWEGLLVNNPFMLKLLGYLDPIIVTATSLVATVSGGYYIEHFLSTAGLGMLGKAFQGQVAPSPAPPALQPPPLQPNPIFDAEVSYKFLPPPKYGGSLGKVVRDGTAPYGEAATTIILSLPAANYILGKVLYSAIPSIWAAKGGGGLTNAGHQLTKHPNIVGGSSAQELAKLYGSGINDVAANALKNLMRNGTRTIKPHKAFGTVVDFKLPSGLGARFNGETNEFIGFLGRGVK